MRVLEIFPSVQGEGPFQGIPSTFVRLAGCNLKCKWCDTGRSRDETLGEDMTVDEVAGRVKRYGHTYVCITGGEPLLQQDELSALLKDLHEDGFIIEIESNGTIDPSPSMEFSSICMDVKCPSSGEKSDLSLIKVLRKRDSLKFVVGCKEDLDYAARIIDEYPTKAEIIISPVWSSDYRAAADYIMKMDRPVRLQVQLHKILGVD